MADVSTGGAASQLGPAVSALRARLSGAVLLPPEPAYQDARRVWNGAIDRRPSAIIVCADAEDVAHAVRTAAEYRLPLTVRGGGHNVAGRALRDDTLLLDLSRLRGVSVNRELRIATVQGGARWQDVDAAAAAVGLVTTGGLVSSTGVGGFTLGGGAGWLMRRYGLACDNLRSAGVVLADGRFVEASAEEHPDLWWGLRGGVGGLGVVTRFEFQLHPLREVLVGLLIHPAERALEALRLFRDFAAEAPDEYCGIAVLVRAPPLPFLDNAWHGRPVAMLAVCWAGAIAAGERALAPLRAFGPPLADHIGPMSYAQWQRTFDPGAPAGRHYYWKTANYGPLEPAVLQQLAAAAVELPACSEIHLQHMGGAVARADPDDSAFAHREARFFVNLIGATEQPGELEGVRSWVRALYERIGPAAQPGVLANFSDQDQADENRWFGRERAARLEELRRRYDPAALLAM